MAYETAFYKVKDLLNYLALKEGDRVLDLGSGSHGYFTFEAAKRVGEKGKVWAVDNYHKAVENIDSLAKLYNHYNVKAVHGDVEQMGSLAFDDNSIDVVFLTNLLSEIKKHNSLLSDVHRLLKKKGKIFIVDWENNDFPNAPKNLVCKKELKSLLENNYYRVHEEIKPGPYHYGYIVIKE